MPSTTENRTLVHPDLQDWMESDTTETRTLLISPVLPERRLSFQPSPKGMSLYIVPSPVGEISLEMEQKMEEQIQSISQLIAEVTQNHPLWLKLAKKFVVEASPMQAKIIARLATIKSIDPNRVLNTLT